ncbi:MAG TPA: triose-phosphate isomerase [Acidimicrobiales bacterium]|nr:triose-phosphate isomerase [Acidimicrobiales bacterium]
MSGNWKMHHDHLQSIRTVQDLGLRLTAADVGPLDVSVHPPFTDLRSVQTVLEDRSIPVALGAQHCFSEDQGAYTGEVAPPMLARLGVSYVIVGHSERRQVFGMTDEQVAVTLRAVLRHGMTPIVCVGETSDERDTDETDARLAAQVTSALRGLPGPQTAGLVIAYEPIWAIGTGVTATGADAEQACAHIRGLVGELAGDEVAQAVRIQYGGSVRPDNTTDLMGQRDVDGLLVGGASLDGATFAAIVRQAGTAAR